MGLFPALHLLAFLVYSGVMLYILLNNPKSLAGRVCAGLTACLGLWSFANIFVFNPNLPQRTVELFTHISAPGWIGMSSFFLWFMLAFTEQRRILEKKYIYLLLFGVPLALITVQWNGMLVSEYTRASFGWRTDWGDSPWVYVFFVYSMSFIGGGIFLGFRVMRRSAGRHRRRVATLITLCLLISFVGGAVADILLPRLGVKAAPDLASLFGLVGIAGIVLAMVKYRFLALTPDAAAGNIITTMFDCLLLLDAEGAVVSANNTALKLLGYSDFELKGMPVGALFGPDDADGGLTDKIVSYKSIQNQELLFQSKVGKMIPMNFSSSLMLNGGGGVEGIVCVARDVTELKRNETIQDVLLNISEAARRVTTLQELLEIVQQQVGRLMDAENFYVALVQDRENAIYTFPFIVDVHPEELVEADESVDLTGGLTDYVLTTDEPQLVDQEKYDDFLKRKRVAVIGARPKSWLGVPLRVSEDEVIGVMVVQSYRDTSAYSYSDRDVLSIISNTIAGAVKYKQAEEALRDSEEKYRILIDNIQDGVFLIYNGKLEFVNEAFARVLGYPLEEMEGMPFQELFADDDRPLIEERYRKRLAGEDVPSEYEFRMAARDGTVVHVNIHVGLINYKDGMAGMGTVKDITARMRAEAEKRELEDRLARSEKMEAIGRLAGGVAHDLNNVLSAIVSYPDLLLMKLPDGSPLRRYICSMQRSGQKAAAIVQDLLTLARRGVSVQETVNLNDIVAEYLKSPEFEKLTKYHPEVRWKTELDGKLLNINGSPVHLAKLVMNLVSNAAEAMPDGGDLVVTTGMRYVDDPVPGFYQSIGEGEYVTLKISDTGVGIAPADLDKIFEPFYTKKEMGRSGTGLGMTVVWGTVEDHDGVIDVTSTEGAGTAFTLFFPVTRSPILAAPQSVSVDAYRGKGERILVVDDVQEQREIASVLLTELGYTVSAAAGGEDAAAMVEKDAYDLLLLDMLMPPGMDGLDTYKAVLNIRPGTKAMITSGFSESDRVKEALQLGAAPYIKKPYTMEKLGLAVKRKLASRG